MNRSAVTSAKKLFLQGFFMLLPLTVTIALFTFIVSRLHGWLAPIRAVLPDILQAVPFSEFILIIIFIMFVGLITQFLLVNTLWSFFERLVSKVPLLHPVYFSIKQLIGAFSSQDTHNFQKIVMFEFPRKGIYSIGFVTCHTVPAVTPTDQPYLSVFLPTTPNPTSGYYLMVPAHECTELALTKQEAMSFIISGGIVHPENVTKKESHD